VVPWSSARRCQIEAVARANRAFLQRAVRFLAGEAGIRQIIDVGTGLPAAGNVHEVAEQEAPGTRVAYVDNDPIVHVYANALLADRGTTSIVLADLRDPEAILAHPKIRALIDFTQPVALLLVAILHFITERENPAYILAVFREPARPARQPWQARRSPEPPGHPSRTHPHPTRPGPARGSLSEARSRAQAVPSLVRRA
jgi:S-adenosyl methyltransferase